LELRTHFALQKVGQDYRFTRQWLYQLFKICKIAKYGRNGRGLTVYVRDNISKRVTEILVNMKEILWIGSGRKIAHI
jgi:hypothetical protein